MGGTRKCTFADLPFELRDQIWQDAIFNPTGLPEAHFIGLANFDPAAIERYGLPHEFAPWFYQRKLKMLEGGRGSRL